VQYRTVGKACWLNTCLQDCIPINTVESQAGIISINTRQSRNSKYNYIQPRPHPREATSLIMSIIHTDIWYSPLIVNTQQVNNEGHLLQEECKYTICCDGGVKDLEGGIGIITEAEDTVILTNKVRVPSTFNGLNSYRAESYGIVTALATYWEIQAYREKNQYPTSNNSLRILCDCKAVIDKVNSIKNVWKMTNKFFTSADADIITSVANLLYKSRKKFGSIKIVHVKGHQDRNGGILSHDAELNVMADEC
jgi:ribonuclease HI